MPKKRSPKKHFFHIISEKIALFQNFQNYQNFQNFSTKFCTSFEGILNYLNINFYEKILKIGFFLAEKLDRHLQWRRL